MDKTYKCRNGHRFKRVEGDRVTCPTCNEPAEPVKWNAVDDFSSTKKGPGIRDSIGSVMKTIKDGFN